jgi:hypothetical protein
MRKALLAGLIPIRRSVQIAGELELATRLPIRSPWRGRRFEGEPLTLLQKSEHPPGVAVEA